MQKHEITVSYLAYDTADELPADEQKLLAKAKLALANSHSPYSNFKVGAAARLADGTVVSSSNYENAAYPLCVCAEHSALIAAANLHPEQPVTTLAITVKNPAQLIDRPALPCGACRQVIRETEGLNGQSIRIILQGETGPVFVFENGEAILPLAFGGEFL